MWFLTTLWCVSVNGASRAAATDRLLDDGTGRMVAYLGRHGDCRLHAARRRPGANTDGWRATANPLSALIMATTWSRPGVSWDVHGPHRSCLHGLEEAQRVPMCNSTDPRAILAGVAIGLMATLSGQIGLELFQVLS